MPRPLEEQKVIQEEVKEHEHLVVDGMDVSGHWNRMFGQRVIWDYDLDNLDKVTELPGGESLEGFWSRIAIFQSIHCHCCLMVRSRRHRD